MDPKAIMRGLLEERRGYELRGLGDRVAQVDAELARLGAVLDAELAEVASEPVEPEAPVADGEAPWFDDDSPADEPEAPVAEATGKRKR